MADLSPLQEADPLRLAVDSAAAKLRAIARAKNRALAGELRTIASELVDVLERRTAWMRDYDANLSAAIAARDREVELLRRALVEAGRCRLCHGSGVVDEVAGVACCHCDATGIDVDLSDETQVAVATAKEVLGG